MPSIILSIKYKKNTGLVISSSELITLFFFGTPPVDTFGNRIDDKTLVFYIQSAQKQIENYLTVKLNRQAYQEDRDYWNDDWLKWGCVPTTYMVVKALSFQGFINTSLQLDYPQEWLSTKRQSPDEDLYRRSINLVPVSGSANGVTNAIVYFGIAPYVGYFGSKNIPNYWKIRYITGFKQVPADIFEAIGKQAAISVFTIIADSVLGVGVASKSQSIDGLSQSISSTASAMYSLFSARIAQYEKDLDRLKRSMKDRYVGITFGTL